MALTDCSVCCSRFNKASRKPVTCLFCDFSACKECTEKYLLGSTSDVHCMSCRKGWNREFMDANFTQKFLTKDYKVHRENVLFDREKSMLPATQVYVERHKRKLEIEVEIKKVDEEIAELNRKRIDLNTRRWRLVGGLPEFDENGSDAGVKKGERREFTRACPADNCKGFLNTQWNCGLCKTNVCNKCHEIKVSDEDHTCLQENVETAKLLNKDSRPCPKCGAMCTKVDGCSQVFAMCCGTTFNWKTGEIETGPIHAPDYFRWLRRNGRDIPRNPQDIPCGGMPNIYDLNRICGKIWPSSQQFNLIPAQVNPAQPNLTEKIINIYRLITHIERIEMPSYRVYDRGEQDNRDLRIKYMLNELEDDKLKTMLQQREKARQKKTNIYNVLSMIHTASVDIFQRMMRSKSASDMMACVNELDELRQYSSKSMEVISNRFKCVTPRIHDDWVRMVSSKV